MCQAGWLAGWLAVLATWARLGGWLAYGSLACWLACRLRGWLGAWLSVRLACSLVGLLAGLLDGWLFLSVGLSKYPAANKSWTRMAEN